MISDEEKEKILKGIWNGSVTVNTLPNEVYVENKDKLKDGVDDGFGTTLSKLKPGTSQAVMMNSLYDNVTFFSAAKTFQQVNDMSFLKFDEQGFMKSFSDFKKDAGKVFDTYNKDWLETEFNTSIQQSQSAEQWLSIQDQKAELPLLKYQTATDERVRDEHAAWDNIIRPVDDPFWDAHMPSNGYNCRCTVIQIPNGSVSSLTGVKKNTNSLFADNVGKSEQVFQEIGKDKHPYFSVEKKYEKLKKDNFGLPMHTTTLVKEVTKTKKFAPAKTVKEAEDRISQLGVKKVDLKGLNVTDSNSVLKSFEKQASFRELSLDELATYRDSKSGFLAAYSPSNNKIFLNLSTMKRRVLEGTPKDFKTQLFGVRDSIRIWETHLEKLKEAVKNPKNIKSARKAKSRLAALEREVVSLEKKIKNKEVPKKFGVSSSQKSLDEYLESTITHEMGHYRDYKQFRNEGGYFNFNKKLSVSNYGATNEAEYFAEAYAEYFHGNKNLVPKDLLKIFESWK